MFNIISWNVLLRKYEEEYHPVSDILSSYPDEKDRVIDIVDLLQKNIDEKTIITLQECSSEIIKELTKVFTTQKIFSHNIRNDEYLVTVAPKDFELEWSGQHPTANAYLVIRNKTTRIVNCHLLPQQYTPISVMKYLLDFFAPDPYRVLFIAGDFNEKHNQVRKELECRFVCPSYGKTYIYKNTAIDQIVFDTVNEYRFTKILQNNMSDHHAIKLWYGL